MLQNLDNTHLLLLGSKSSGEDNSPGTFLSQTELIWWLSICWPGISVLLLNEGVMHCLCVSAKLSATLALRYDFCVFISPLTSFSFFFPPEVLKLLLKNPIVLLYFGRCIYNIQIKRQINKIDTALDQDTNKEIKATLLLLLSVQTREHGESLHSGLCFELLCLNYEESSLLLVCLLPSFHCD